jgi:hypothetical protein
MHKIVYDEATLEEFRQIAGEPVWKQWIEDNKDKFDAQGLFDQMMALIKEAQDKGM